MTRYQSRFWKSLACVVLSATSLARADFKDDIGYSQLFSELGATLVPTGAGVAVSQIEADGDGTAGSPFVYRPNTALGEFSGITFTFPSGGDTGSSGHATSVGRYFYGDTTGIAGGISQVACYEATNWLTSGFLRTNNVLGQAPLVETNKVHNHSWVGLTGSSTLDTQILLRYDYAISRDDLVAVVGVNNGTGNDRNLLSSSYNVISVGLTSGAHSHGATSIPTAGRQRPHLVAPHSATSFATPMVAAAAALMVETAGPSAHGKDHRTIKAVLLTGATKQEFANWSQTSSQPLDAVYGAGELNVYNSYHIMAAGEQTASASADVATAGWDMAAVSSSAGISYFLEISEGGLFNLSATLIWDAVVTPGLGNNFNDPSVFVPDLKLELFSALGYSLGTLLSFSDSNVDNLEHLWVTNLTAGRYAILVTSGFASLTDYALAWQLTSVPEPAFFFIALPLVLIIVRRLSRRTA